MCFHISSVLCLVHPRKSFDTDPLNFSASRSAALAVELVFTLILYFECICVYYIYIYLYLICACFVGRSTPDFSSFGYFHVSAGNLATFVASCATLIV